MLSSNVGYSIAMDAYKSGEETARKTLDNMFNPRIGFLYANYQDIDKVLEGAKSILDETPIIGSTVKDSIMVQDGIVSCESGFSGMMIIDDENMQVAVAGSERGKNPREIGRRVALEAIRNSGLKIKPSYMYMVAFSREEELYLKGIQDVVGRVPIFGGSVIEDKNSRIFCNDKILKSGCAVAFFYTINPIATEYASYYQETTNMGVITKVDRYRTIVKIDNVLALKKYMEWRNMKPKDLKEEFSYTLSPLAIKDVLGDVTVLRNLVDSSNNAMKMSNDVKEGTAVIRMETTVEELINSPKKAIDHLNRLIDEEVGAYFLVHNMDRKLAIGSDLDKVYTKVKKAVGEIPFLMIFTSSEYGYSNCSANTCGSLMLSFTAFSK